MGGLRIGAAALPEPVGIFSYCKYTSNGNDGDLYTVPSNGGTPTLVLSAATDHELRDSEVSLDNTKITFVDNDTNSGAASVKVCDADGSNVVSLATITTVGFYNRAKPRFSPDGTQVTFCDTQFVFPTTTARLKIVNVDGTGLTTLATTTTSSILGYSWRRDGAKIVYASDGNTRVINPDGTGGAVVFATGTVIPQYGYTTDKIYYFSSVPRSVNEDGSGDAALSTGGNSPLSTRYYVDLADTSFFWGAGVSSLPRVLSWCDSGGSAISQASIQAGFVEPWGSRVYGIMSDDGGSTFVFASTAIDGTDFRTEDSDPQNWIFLPVNAFG